MTTARRIASSPLCLFAVAFVVTACGWSWAVADPPQDAGDAGTPPAAKTIPSGSPPEDVHPTINGQANAAPSNTGNTKPDPAQPKTEPASGLRPLELPDIDLSQLPQLDPEDDSAAVQFIQNAVDGKPLGGPVNDGILSDVLQVIRNSPHRIDTSNLDPDQLTEGRTALVPQVEVEATVARQTRARAAEQLLKASRLLERAGKNQSQRMDLVNRMRAEAVSLLSE